MTTLDIEGLNQEYLLLEFAGDDKVYVPPSLAGLVEKYSSRYWKILKTLWRD